MEKLLNKYCLSLIQPLNKREQTKMDKIKNNIESALDCYEHENWLGCMDYLEEALNQLREEYSNFERWKNWALRFMNPAKANTGNSMA